jgi:outer membrane immunogenic protein
MAADMQVKAPIYLKAPTADIWSGFYLGGSVGGRWDTETVTASHKSGMPNDFDSSSPRVGVYGGYNWQVRQNWVLGLEGDFAWANDKTSAKFVPGLAGSGITAATTLTDKWDAGVRARAGFLVTPSTLLFGTAGVSWLESETDVTATSVWKEIKNCKEITKSVTASASDSETTAGWTLGGGIETVVQPNWLLRGEYRYSNYGNRHATLLKGSEGQGHLHSVDLDLGKSSTQTVLVGLAHQF